MSEFLGPYGQATVILMKAHFDTELPKLKDLNKLLHIPDGKYYKSNGRNSYSVQRLERLLNVLSEIRGEQCDWSRYRSSNYLITVSEVNSNLFMSLKYSAQVVDGFNLTDACMDELENLMRAYSSICSMRSDVDHFWSTLEQNKETAEKDGFQDPTVSDPDLYSLQKLLYGYGDKQYLKACSDLNDWYNTYRWKVSSGKPKESSAQPEEPAEAV